MLATQVHIQELKLPVDDIFTQITNVSMESVRIGHMFNRTIIVIWNCFMVCGLKALIVSTVKSFLD